MTFFDSNDFITLYELNSKIDNLNSDKEYYLEKIDEVKLDRDELLSDSDNLEKFARERYLMKKESEDIYVIVEE